MNRKSFKCRIILFRKKILTTELFNSFRVPGSKGVKGSFGMLMKLGKNNMTYLKLSVYKRNISDIIYKYSI